MMTSRNKSSVDCDRDIFEKSLNISLNKAINVTECAVKEKHARIVIIASHKERSGSSYWFNVRKLPLQDNPLIAWKFCHVTHKLLRDGHPNVIKDSFNSLSFIRDLGKLWGHLKEGYGVLIASYTHLLYQKLLFHQKNPQILQGNLVMDDEQLDQFCNNDINSYFELSVDMLDYMDCILQLQKYVFSSMDMSRSNSMTSSGQCRLAPLIPCIQDSCQLYHFLVQFLFKLHSSLPADTLSGHRERFYKQFNMLKQFYVNAKNLQYFKNLIQIPDLPNTSPNFLRACELSSHVKPMALVSEPEDYGNETDNVDNTAPDLIETELSSKDDSELRTIETLLFEKNLYIEKLENDLRELKREIERIRKEDQMALESLHNQIQELENEIIVQKQIISSTTQENEILKSILKEKDEERNTITDEQFGIVERLAKTNEDKFQKMKEVYGKLREEHVQLLRASSESAKRLSLLKKENEMLEDKCKNISQELEEYKLEECKAIDELKKYKNSYEELSCVTKLNNSLEIEKKELENKVKVLEEEVKNGRDNVEKLMAEMSGIHEHLNIVTNDRHKCQKKLDESELIRTGLVTKLNEALAKNITSNEDLNKYSVEKQQLILSLKSSQQQINDLDTELAGLTSRCDELTKLQQNLLLEKKGLQKECDLKLNELNIKNQSLSDQIVNLGNMSFELSCCHSKIKEFENQIILLQRENNFFQEEKNALQKNFEENKAYLSTFIEQQKKEIDRGVQKDFQKNSIIIGKLVYACGSMIDHSLSQVKSIHFSELRCTADYLVENIKPTIESLQDLEEILMKDNPDLLLDSEMLLSNMINFSFLASEIIELALATAHSASIDAGEAMANLAQNIGRHMKVLLDVIKPESIEKKEFLNQSRLLKNLLEILCLQATDLIPKFEDIQSVKMDDLIEKEMQQTSQAIDEAASRIAKILASSRSQQSGIQLEVSEKILDSCNTLMMKIRILIEKSKFLQKEIVSQGRGEGWLNFALLFKIHNFMTDNLFMLGTSTVKDFYKKHHRWTEGLISAAKAVGFGANLLVDAADKVVSGKEKFEELVVCAQEISASTAQLVVASKVKAERGSENLCSLSEASKGVSEATGLVVASAKSGAERVEELEIFDFSKLTLHQAKRKEMDSQVRVLELESLLDKERRKLAELRKTHYQLAGESEGWEASETGGLHHN